MFSYNVWQAPSFTSFVMILTIGSEVPEYMSFFQIGELGLIAGMQLISCPPRKIMDNDKLHFIAMEENVTL
jgi:hypothetical protein